MTKKKLEQRRQRNQELARIDAANRCHECKISLVDRISMQLMPYQEKYCAECYEALYGKPGAER